MSAIWFCLVAFMLAVYVLLDGFDLGVGILHLGVARTDAERRAVISHHRSGLGRATKSGCSPPVARSTLHFPRFTLRASAASICR